MSSEKLRILEMIQDGKLTPEEGLELIQALDSPGVAAESYSVSSDSSESCCGDTGHSHKKRARCLMIKVDDQDSGKNVNIRIPIALAKFAGKFIPKEAKAEMAAQGVDLDLGNILEQLQSETGDNLIEVTEGGKKIVKIYCE